MIPELQCKTRIRADNPCTALLKAIKLGEVLKRPDGEDTASPLWHVAVLPATGNLKVLKDPQVGLWSTTQLARSDL